MPTSFLPVYIDLLLVRGTDNRFEVTFVDPSLGVPIDLTSETVKLTVRDGFTGTQLLQKTNAPGQHSSPTAGKTILVVTRTEIADAANAAIRKDFRYEIRRIQSNGDQNVYFAGFFQLNPTPA